MLSKEERDQVDFDLANIEAFFLKPKDQRLRENADISASNLRRILDVYHVAGVPGAVTRDEAREQVKGGV